MRLSKGAGLFAVKRLPSSEVDTRAPGCSYARGAVVPLEYDSAGTRKSCECLGRNRRGRRRSSL